ncbi:13559_t:CDS:1 [Dentiscutata erythropus]|uniref:13559_t:CDS:1 n=1 Tax=Dentiscutata erythropus TaxID=1348616 RepID=A0A9N9I1E8_9GLOM|nr:13559_t:CDS:1 [Dentiscutata erythropus]
MPAQTSAQIQVQQVQDLINQSRTPPALLRIFSFNVNSHARNLWRTNNNRYITGYGLLRTKIKEEGLLINVTDGFVIGKSTDIIWGGFTPTERNVFINYASQIRAAVRN